MTLAAACARWQREVGDHLQEADLPTAIERMCRLIGPKKLLHDIRDDDVARAVAERRRDLVRAGKDDRGKQLYRPIMPRTVNRTVPLLLRRVMRRARDAWNVVIFREPKWKTHRLEEAKRPINEISVGQEEAIEAVERDDYRAIRRFALITGLRLNECLLTWPQVDFEEAVVRIVAKGNEPRVVPLTREAYQILWEERGRHPMWVFTFIAQKTRVCPKTKQKYERGKRYPITYWGLSSQRRRQWPKAGVKARWHDLRHTTGMRTLRSTGNLKLAQRVLGHADIGTTAKFYTDALVEDVRAAMERTATWKKSREKSRTAAAAPDKALKAK